MTERTFTPTQSTAVHFKPTSMQRGPRRHKPIARESDKLQAEADEMERRLRELRQTLAREKQELAAKKSSEGIWRAGGKGKLNNHADEVLARKKTKSRGSRTRKTPTGTSRANGGTSTSTRPAQQPQQKSSFVEMYGNANGQTETDTATDTQQLSTQGSMLQPHPPNSMGPTASASATQSASQSDVATAAAAAERALVWKQAETALGAVNTADGASGGAVGTSTAMGTSANTNTNTSTSVSVSTKTVTASSSTATMGEFEVLEGAEEEAPVPRKKFQLGGGTWNASDSLVPGDENRAPSVSTANASDGSAAGSGEFNEAESHASFMEALEEWRAGRAAARAAAQKEQGGDEPTKTVSDTPATTTTEQPAPTETTSSGTSPEGMTALPAKPQPTRAPQTFYEKLMAKQRAAQMQEWQADINNARQARDVDGRDDAAASPSNGGSA